MISDSKSIDQEALAAGSEERQDPEIDDARSILGQGPLTAEVFSDDDPE